MLVGVISHIRVPFRHCWSVNKFEMQVLQLTALLILAATATVTSAEPNTNGASSIARKQGNLQKPLSSNWNLTSVQAFADGNFAFSKNLHQKLRQSEPLSNLVFSPFSLSSVLAMTYLGAKGKCRRELQDVLKFPRSRSKVAKGYRKYFTSLKDAPVTVANKLYLKQGLEIHPKFLKRTKWAFGAEAQEIDFAQSTTAAKTINGWVGNATKGHITDLVSPDAFNSLTQMVLLNAVHFKGTWKSRFERNLTTKAAFHVSENKQVQADFMFLHDRVVEEAYFPRLSAHAVRIPYEGDRLSMLVILPDRSKSVSDLERELLEQPLDSLLKEFSQPFRALVLQLPKFKIEASPAVKVVLSDLGMSAAFAPGAADFSGIAGLKGDLYVSDIFHKAVIEVHEEGTTAAAASGVVMKARSMPSRFVADRPFVFMIVDVIGDSNVVLFSGTCVDPTMNSDS